MMVGAGFRGQKWSYCMVAPHRRQSKAATHLVSRSGLGTQLGLPLPETADLCPFLGQLKSYCLQEALCDCIGPMQVCPVWDIRTALYFFLMLPQKSLNSYLS